MKLWGTARIFAPGTTTVASCPGLARDIHRKVGRRPRSRHVTCESPGLRLAVRLHGRMLMLELYDNKNWHEALSMAMTTQ
jgi:hypothetical protein